MGGVRRTFCLGWPGTMILPISASHIARITGVSHWQPACTGLLYSFLYLYWFSPESHQWLNKMFPWLERAIGQLIMTSCFQPMIRLNSENSVFRTGHRNPGLLSHLSLCSSSDRTSHLVLRRWQTYNPSYSALANSFRDPISKKHPSQKRAGGEAQRVGPEFKPQYCKKKKKKKRKKERKMVMILSLWFSTR
jgi:hypothetical protein